MRRIGFALLYCAYVAAFAAIVDYVFFWRPFRAELSRNRPEELRAPRYVDDATMRRIGSLRADRRSSFVNYPRDKPAGVLRLCAFGDSFTYGDEAADGHDFPAFLQRVFVEHGAGNVEVLSFGNPWYGLHQAHLLWDGVGRRFGCDLVLLGPDCFQPERDTTFNHTGLAFPYYLHARYVLDGEGVRRVDVLGRNAHERFEEYFAFLPRTPYLRYDRNAPAFLQAMLPSGRILPNPFYYFGGTPEEEAYASYERLLRNWARDGVQIVVLHALTTIVEIANRVGGAVVAAHAPRMERFPYHAPGGHFSSFGNRWIAEQYYSLMSETPEPPTVLRFEDPQDGSAPASAGDARAESHPPISSYDRIYAELGDRRVGFLAIASAVPSERGGTAEDLAGSNVVGLLVLEPAGASVVDAAFVPTPTAPREGDALTLRSDDAQERIATVHLLDARLNVAVAVVPNLVFAGDLVLQPPGAGRGGTQAANSSASVRDVVVLMGETPVLRAASESSPLHLEPIAGKLRTLRVGEGEYAPIGELGSEGVVSLVLEKDGAGARIPLARWQRRFGEIFSAPRRLPTPVVVANGRAFLNGTPATPPSP